MAAGYPLQQEEEAGMTSKERKAESGKRIHAARLANETPEQRDARTTKKKNQAAARKQALTPAQLESRRIKEHEARELKKLITSDGEKRELMDRANARIRASNDAMTEDELGAKRKRLSTALAERRRSRRLVVSADEEGDTEEEDTEEEAEKDNAERRRKARTRVERDFVEEDEGDEDEEDEEEDNGYRCGYRSNGSIEYD